MNLITLYKAMLKRAATTMPEMPAMAGVVQPKVPQNPLPPPISIAGSAKPEDAASQTGLSQEGGVAQDTTIADLTSALNNITSVEKMKLKGEQMAQGIGQPQQGAALAQVTASQPSSQQGSGAAAPLAGINKASKALYDNLGSVYNSLMKRASWLGRQVNNVFGDDTWMGRTFGESVDTAAENFYNSQISPEMQAQRKADAAKTDATISAASNRINGNINKAVANAQPRSPRGRTQSLAKQQAAEKYIAEIAAKSGRQLSPEQIARIRQKAAV